MTLTDKQLVELSKQWGKEIEAKIFKEVNSHQEYHFSAEAYILGKLIKLFNKNPAIRDTDSIKKDNGATRMLFEEEQIIELTERW